MGNLEGKISIAGLPPNFGYILSLALFRVTTPEDPPPYGGDPAPDIEGETHPVAKTVDLNREIQESKLEESFSLQQEPGFYYAQVRVVLFRRKEGRVLAQSEQFFFKKRPLPVAVESVGRMTFPVEWPAVPLEDLHHYSTLHPAKGCLGFLGRWGRKGPVRG
jgi:hypothetical protein